MTVALDVSAVTPEKLSNSTAAAAGGDICADDDVVVLDVVLDVDVVVDVDVDDDVDDDVDGAEGQAGPVVAGTANPTQYVAASTAAPNVSTHVLLRIGVPVLPSALQLL